MSVGAIKAGDAFVRIFSKDETDKGLASAKAKLNQFANQVGAIGASLTAVAAAGLAGLGASVKMFSDIGSDLNDMSARTGLSASKLAELGYAAEQSGASLGDVEMALRTMAKKGFNVNDFDRIAKGIAAIPDPSERAAKAMEVFGKSGTKLLPMLADLDRLSAKANWMGIVPSAAAVKAADNLGDAFGDVSAAMKATFFNVGAALAPAMQSLSETILKVIAGTNHFVKANQGLVRVLAITTAAVAGMGFTLIGLSIAIKGYILLTNLWSFAQVAYAGAASLAAAANVVLGASWLAAMGPLALAIGLVAAAIVSFGVLAVVIANALSNDWLFRTMGLHLGQLLFIVKETVAGIFNAFASGNFELAGKIAMAGLIAAFTAGVFALREIIGKFAIWATEHLTRIFGDLFDMMRPIAAQIGIELPSADDLSFATQYGITAAIRKARDDARKAMDELNKLNKEAKDALEGKSGDKPPGAGPNPFGGSIKIPKSIQTTIRETDKAVSSGAFSGFAAMHLSRNKPEVEIQERIVTELKEQTVLLKDLVENTEEGGAEFGE